MRNVAFDKKACLAAAGIADHDCVQVALVVVGIVTEADILGENDFLLRIHCFVLRLSIPPQQKADCIVQCNRQKVLILQGVIRYPCRCRISGTHNYAERLSSIVSTHLYVLCSVPALSSELYQI